ncbi:MAG TPA: hypothetical protein VGB18_07835, partial [Candidatus Thermoplasmatota archaeon]
MTTGDRIALWPIIGTLTLVLFGLIAIVVLRGSFVALIALALLPVAILVLWGIVRGKWLRAQVDALPRYLASRRVHVVIAEANEMQTFLTRLQKEWGWTWAKKPAFEENLATLAPHVGRARSTGLYGLRTRRPERVPKEQLLDTMRIHRDFRRHLVLSLAQELETREQRHSRDLAALRERGLCTFDAGTGLSKEPRWIGVTARINRIRDDQLLAVKEAVSTLQGAMGETQAIRSLAEERQRAADVKGAIEALLRLRPRPVAPLPTARTPAAAPPAPTEPPTTSPPAPDREPSARPRRKGD